MEITGKLCLCKSGAGSARIHVAIHSFALAKTYRLQSRTIKLSSLSSKYRKQLNHRSDFPQLKGNGNDIVGLN